MATDLKFFTVSQIDLMTAVLDRIIPADGVMPGAGTIAVDFLDDVVGASSALKRNFGVGLSELEAQAQVACGNDFINLSDDDKDEVLRQIEAAHPEFFEALVRQTYDGYYSNSRILQALGLEARPPQPRGHRLERGNVELIENVKKRGIAYRDVRASNIEQ